MRAAGHRRSTVPPPGHHLAQANVMHAKCPPDDPRMAEFVALLAPMNRLADSSPGFVWRLQTEDGDATGIQAFDDPLTLINMSVWQSQEALWNYAYASQHLNVMRRRREWVAKVADVVLALWWVEAGHIPTVTEANQRLALLRAHGPTPGAFTFRQSFPPPGPGLAEADGYSFASHRDGEATREAPAGRGDIPASPPQPVVPR
ncbi:MAG: hypothetical protein QOI35_3421 [Cryptosporangiaceae bacterium]|nr:hypothetical protein [Cryptosporangiaceae bacterium]